MVFWLAILAGGLFVWLAVHIGFYETWVLCFNIIISVYVAIFLAPAVVAFAPGTGGVSPYGMALSMLVLAGGCFALLHGLSYVYLTGQFRIPFPQLFDILLSGVVGFLAGFLVLSFLALVVTTTPLAAHKYVRGMGFNRASQQTNLSWIAHCCDPIHSITHPEAGGQATQAAVDRLLQTRPSGDRPEAGEPNEPSPIRRSTAPPQAPS